MSQKSNNWGHLNLMIQSKFLSPNFLESLGIKFESKLWTFSNLVFLKESLKDSPSSKIWNGELLENRLFEALISIVFQSITWQQNRFRRMGLRQLAGPTSRKTGNCGKFIPAIIFVPSSMIVIRFRPFFAFFTESKMGLE